MFAALMLVVGTSIAMSALLTWSVRRTWTAVSTLSALASRIAVSAEMLTAQGQTQTAHAALLSGSVDQLRRDLAFPTHYELLEEDDL
jgi:phage protein D